MNKIFGIVILFAAAWLMYRLQAGSGSCCGGNHGVESSDHGHSRDCCEDTSSGSEKGSGSGPGPGT